MKPIRLASILALAICIVTPTALAESFYVSPDVPTLLNGAFRLPHQVVENGSGGYTTVLSLPASTAIDGLHRMDGGDWLFSLSYAATLGSTTYQRADVVRYDPGPGTYTLFFDGAAAGIPATSNVDALLLDGGDSGDLVIGFDVPTSLGGATYDPSDLVRVVAGNFSLFFDGSAAGLLAFHNATGADVRGTRTILSFEAPTTLGASTYLPGELAAWDGLGFAPFHSDPAWPVSSRADALCLLSSPGRVQTITVTKLPIAPNVVQIDWSPSCSSGAEDYGIYEGQVGNWTSHVMIDCEDEGRDRSEQIQTTAGDHYYLVVPRNANDEGSYGIDSNNNERPRPAMTCAPTQEIGVCP